MALEYGQVNPQELQRLSELIQMTQEAMRRTMPQVGFGQGPQPFGAPQGLYGAAGGMGGVHAFERFAEMLNDRIVEGVRDRLPEALHSRIEKHWQENIRAAVSSAWPWTQVPMGVQGGMVAERLVETIRERIEEGLRERLADEIRERLAEGLRERIGGVIRASFGDLGPLGERLVEEVRNRITDRTVSDRLTEVLRERLMSGVRQRIVEGIQSALMQAQQPGAFGLGYETPVNRVTEAVFHRLRTGIREQLHDVAREHLRKVLHHRVVDAVRGTLMQPGVWPPGAGIGAPGLGYLADQIRERVVEELPERITDAIRERLLEGLRDRIVETVRTAHGQGIHNDPERLADWLRDRIVEGLGERLGGVVRDRIREGLRERFDEAIRNVTQLQAGQQVQTPGLGGFAGAGLPSFVNLQQRQF